MLIIKYKHYSSELIYSLDVLLKGFFGFNYQFKESTSKSIEISQEGSLKKLSLNADFFEKIRESWLSVESMPATPLLQWQPTDELGLGSKLIKQSIPILYGQPGLVKKNNNHMHLNVDIFGSAFFMLSRYEEVVIPTRDEHDRFKASASIAYQENFLDRPIINEYIEILWACLSSLFPALKRKNREYRKLVSCDVDHPTDKSAESIQKIIRRVGVRIIIDKNPRLAFTDFLNYLASKLKLDIFDSYKNSITWMIKANDQAKNIITFNFIPIQTNAKYEDDNDIENKDIKQIISEIIKSGHKVGIHPGYNTCNNPKNFKLAVYKLRKTLLDLSINQNNIGGRQHYLKYDVSITPSLWNKYNLDYDSSIGYVECAGFRAGCCYEYSMYDLINRKKMNLKQLPLIAMDCTIISKPYEGLDFTHKALERFKYFENICKSFDGNYTLLWHNSFFTKPQSKKFYLDLIND